MIDSLAVWESSGHVVESILESMREGFFSLDDEFRFTYLNGAAETILGVRRADMLGKSLWEQFPRALGTQFECIYREVMETGTSRRFEEFYPEPLSAWYEVGVQPAGAGIVVYFQDISARRMRDQEREELLRSERHARALLEAAHRRLAHQAAHDPLTGLSNRAGITRLGHTLLDQGTPMVLLFMDLDRFKLVNDSLGHAAGDELLVEVAGRLRAALGPADLCARLGGDEFVALLVGASALEAEQLAVRLLDGIRRPIRACGRVLSVTTSIGLAVSGRGSTIDTLLRDADIALYRAKDSGRDRCNWYDAATRDHLIEQIALESDLREALASKSLKVQYQSVHDLDSMQIVGAEALARWQHPGRGVVPPSTFIPLAEDAGLICGVTAAVLEQACAEARSKRHVDHFRIWVNVSPRQFETPGLADAVVRAAHAAGVPPERLGIEITESALADERAAQRELGRLTEAGFAVAVDDFGTGYSSLARLQDLPIHVLKIDKSFVRRTSTCRGRAAVKAIIDLAHAFEMTTIAEGIESAAELVALQELGSDFGSGYLLGRPRAGSATTAGG